MSNFFVFNNIHLGLELAGAVIFFLISWLYFEAFLTKKDTWSATRAFGFIFLSASQLFHAVYASEFNYSPLIYAAGMVILIFSFGMQKLPPKPESMLGGALFVPLIPFFSQSYIPLVLNLLLFAVLIKRFVKDIERFLKPLAFGFLFLAIASVVTLFPDQEILEHILKFIGFIWIGFWAKWLLSLRIREEALLVFVGASLFIALLVTTAFSAVLLKRIENEVNANLIASSKIFDFYIDSLKSKALASLNLIAQNENFVSAFLERDLADMERISGALVENSGLQFLTVAQTDGRVIFKLNFPAVSEESILAENIGLEAMNGHIAVTLEKSDSEGLSIRAAAPIFSRGRVSGVVISGYLLDDAFLKEFKNISGYESSIFTDKKVAASTIFNAGDALSEPEAEALLNGDERFVDSTLIFGEEVIGSFSPLKNIDNQTVATLVITTTPGELLLEAGGTNRLTLFIISLIVLALVIPLYRFTVFLTGA